MITGCFQCVVIQHKYNEIQIDTIKIIVKNITIYALIFLLKLISIYAELPNSARVNIRSGDTDR